MEIKPLTYESHGRWQTPFRAQARVLGRLSVGLSFVAVMLVLLAVVESKSGGEAIGWVRASVRPTVVGLGWSAFVVGVLALALLVSYAVSMRQADLADVQFKQFEDGQFMVHWKYLDEQWEPYVRRTFARAHAQSLFSFVVVPFAAMLGWGIGIGPARHSRAGDPGSPAGLLLGLLIGFTIALALYGLCLWVNLSRRNLRRRLGGEVWIGKRAVYVTGMSFTLEPPYRFQKAWFDPQRSELVFLTCFSSGRRGAREKHRVPVPAGGEEIAQRIVVTLHHTYNRPLK